MSAILDVDLDTYCGRIANLYIRRGLCPPFELRRIAADWKASGVALAHVVTVIDRHLTDHSRRYYSGSGDALFTWLDEVVRKTWYEQHDLPSQARGPTMQRFAAREWGHHQQGGDHEVDVRRNPDTSEPPAGNRSHAPGCCGADQAQPHSVNSIGHTRKQRSRFDEAVAFLLRELANGEVAATRLEQKAKASGISTRTLDRARARLKVVSRRTGFAKDGKCWCSLPTTP